MWFWFAFPLWPGMVSIFFMCFLAIWTSFEKTLLRTFVHFFIGSLIFGGGSLVFELPVYSGYQSLVWGMDGKGFLAFCGWPLQFRDLSFVVQKILISCNLICQSFLLVVEQLECSSVFLALSSTSFKVPSIILRSLIHFELILVHGERHGLSLSLL
jgi:hypothetical protein